MTSQNPTPTAATVELAALRRIVAALERLDESAQDRVVGWLCGRYRRPASVASWPDPVATEARLAFLDAQQRGPAASEES